MTATLGEAEVLYAANDEVKQMAQSGDLQALHERCASLHEASERLYISTKDKITNIIQAC